MAKLTRINALCRERGIENPNQLRLLLGIKSFSTATRLFYDEGDSIDYATVERVRRAFGIEDANDIFDFSDFETERAHAAHAD